MKNPIISLVTFIMMLNTCFCSTASGQKEFGFKMPKRIKRVDIPFEQHNNLIIIPLRINYFVTLKFILDTGVENAILTEKAYADLLEVNYLREISINGPGLVDSVEAYIANDITFGLPGGIIGKNMNLLVLKEDYLQLSENIGDDVHGIIGYDVFSRFVVSVNYDDNILTLYDPGKFKKNKHWIELPMQVQGSKPFVQATIQQKNQKASLDMMVDTGASHAALIDYNHLNGMTPPERTIETQLGRGIAGEIPGHVGRMDSVEIAGFNFTEMLVSSPFDGAYNKSIKRGSRVGTFGGDLLNRFHVTFNYPDKKIYLKKGDHFRKTFEFDMSGMKLNAIGTHLDILKVVDVDAGSPAYKADIRKGDIIHIINGRSLRTNTLSDIYKLLQSRDGRKIRCKIKRDGEKKRTQFRLKRVI